MIFGKPAAEAVPAEMARQGVSRAFVTSTASLARLSDGPLQAVLAGLGATCVGVHDHIRAHSPEEDVVEAAKAARAAGADVLVAVGGGSVIDATKAVQMCLWFGADSVDAMREAGARMAAAREAEPGGAMRIIAVPTTLSAAEFTSTAGITDTARGPRGRTVCTVWDLKTRAGEPAVPTHHAALAEHQEIATTLKGRDVAWGAGAGYAALPMIAL